MRLLLRLEAVIPKLYLMSNLRQFTPEQGDIMMTLS